VGAGTIEFFLQMSVDDVVEGPESSGPSTTSLLRDLRDDVVEGPEFSGPSTTSSTFICK